MRARETAPAPCALSGARAAPSRFSSSFASAVSRKVGASPRRGRWRSSSARRSSRCSFLASVAASVGCAVAMGVNSMRPGSKRAMRMSCSSARTSATSRFSRANATRSSNLPAAGRRRGGRRARGGATSARGAARGPPDGEGGARRGRGDGAALGELAQGLLGAGQVGSVGEPDQRHVERGERPRAVLNVGVAVHDQRPGAAERAHRQGAGDLARGAPLGLGDSGVVERARR